MKRRTLKTITWSLTAFTVTMLVGWFATGDPLKGGMIAFVCRAIKIPAYFWHDGLYDRFYPVIPELCTVDADGTSEGWHEDFELESRRMHLHLHDPYAGEYETLAEQLDCMNDC